MCQCFLILAYIYNNAPATTGGRIRSKLIRGCSHNHSIQYPNVQWGYGTLDFIRAFNYLREY